MEMRSRHQSRFVAVVAVVALACSPVTEPNVLPGPATVVVQRDTLVARFASAGDVDWISFDVPVAIHNATSAPLTFDICHSTIDTQRNGEWQAEWSLPCYFSDVTAPIQPGETREVSVNFTTSIQGPGGPARGSTPVIGTYRFTAALLPPGFVGTTPKVGSNAFTLVKGS